jgi:hypothetical protein
MSLAECVIAAALRDKSACGYPLWQYDSSYEPLLQAMRERGEAVRIDLDDLLCDAKSAAEKCHRLALALCDWYEPSAARRVLLREADARECHSLNERSHPTWRKYDARYAKRLRAVADGIKAQP